MNNLKVLGVHRCSLHKLPFKKVEEERETLLLTKSIGQRYLSDLDSSIDKGTQGVMAVKHRNIRGILSLELGCLPQPSGSQDHVLQ